MANDKFGVADEKNGSGIEGIAAADGEDEGVQRQMCLAPSGTFGGNKS